MPQFASASFTGADGTALETADANWSNNGATAGAAVIQSIAVRKSDGNTAWKIHSATPPSADYSVSSDITHSGSTNFSLGPVGRSSTTAQTGYHARVLQSTATAAVIQLFRFNAGTATQLGSNQSISYSSGNTVNLRLEMIGSTIKVFRDGSATPLINQSDASPITDVGKTGFRGGGTSPSNTNALLLDNFSADDTAAGAALAASVQGAASTSAALSTAIRLAASAAGVSSATAGLSTGISLAASAAATATASAGLSAGNALSASATASATASAIVTTGIRLAASAIGASSAAANLSAPGSAGLSAAALATATSTASLLATKPAFIPTATAAYSPASSAAAPDALAEFPARTPIGTDSQGKPVTASRELVTHLSRVYARVGGAIAPTNAQLGQRQDVSEEDIWRQDPLAQQAMSAIDELRQEMAFLRGENDRLRSRVEMLEGAIEDIPSFDRSLPGRVAEIEDRLQ